MLFTAVDHHAIACYDVQRQIDWYCKHLGMQLVVSNGLTPPSAVVGYAPGAGGGAMIELMPAREPGPPPGEGLRFQPGIRHIALRVSDFDEACKRLLEAGVMFLTEPGEAAGGGRIISFRDPEGNELQIVQR